MKTLSVITTGSSITISRATISSVTGITAANKVYAGMTDATLNTEGAGFTGMVSGDDPGVASPTGAFTDKNVGNDITVKISGIKLGGTDAGNYPLSDTTAAT